MTDPTQNDAPPAFYPPRTGSGLPSGLSEPGSSEPGSSGKDAPSAWIKRPTRPPVMVLLQPEEKEIELPKAKTARAVLIGLGLRECTALVIRDGQLLTPDRAVAPGERLTVRKVTSSG